MKDSEANQAAHAQPNPHAHQPAAPDPTSRGNSTRHWIIGIVAFLVLALCVWLVGHWLAKPRAKPPGPSGVPVSTGPARAGSIDIYLDALGTVTPIYTVTVTSRVSGELTEVHFTEGQMVKKGDLLAVIDPRPYEAMLLQAQGQLSRDQALLKNARLDLSRYRNAFEQHAIPEQQLATQQALVEQDMGVVQLDQGNLASAQVNVDYTRIVSPIDGRVGLRGVDPGNIVTADGTTGLATITQLQPISVIFTIAEDDLSRVAEQVATGRSLKVIALDRSQQHTLAQGTLATLDNQINLATGTVRVRATFPNLKNELFPNQFVNARLLVKTLANVVLVPAASIQRNNEKAFVYVVQPGDTVESRDVKIKATEGETAAVTGVTAGEQLVTDGFDKLQSGTKIIIRSAPAARAPAASSE
jgi:multidrug efflux system membrane fusion protein